MTIASAHLAAPLVVRTVEIADPGSLLALLPAHAPLSWVRRGAGLVGWGEAARWTGHGPDQFADADRWWRTLIAGAVVRDAVDHPGSGPVAFGSFAFDPGSARGGTLIVPKVTVGHRDGRWWVTTASANGQLPTAPAEPLRPQSGRRPVGVRVVQDTGAATRWLAMVTSAVARITAGELEKVVLAREVSATAEQPLDLPWLLAELAEVYPSCWTFAVDGLFGATPELLLRLERGLVHSRVLAGTIRRTGDDARDLALAGSLARSSKDLEEHEYAVRSVAQALAPYCASMNVPEAPFVLHLANVMHLATDVAGVLREASGLSALGLVAALHPSAAVCGTPTRMAQRLIQELEGLDRGRYAGPVGWIDAHLDGEWGIALRCAELDPHDARRLRLFAGCGIVAGSDPAAELAESKAKLVPMRQALGISP